MDTNALIQELANSAAPVQRLPAPWARMLIWLAISVPILATVIWLLMPSDNPVATIADRRFLIEEAALLVTALTASLAAFGSVVPGYDRRILLIPLLPLAAWLASLGEGCWRNWVALGANGLTLRADWDCLPPAILIGVMPSIAMVVMLRRGAPLLPRISIALGALAVAALANLGLRLFHVGDASVMVLFWHLGGAAVLTGLAALAGRSVLYWRHAHHARDEVVRP
jgi:hypothetical protein